MSSGTEQNNNGGQPITQAGAIRYLTREVTEKNKMLFDLKHDFLLVGDHLGVDKATGRMPDYLDAIAKLKKENEELIKNMGYTQDYWRCFMSYVDPKGHLGHPDKEHIDTWCEGDEELKQHLCEEFGGESESEEEEEEED